MNRAYLRKVALIVGVSVFALCVALDEKRIVLPPDSLVDSYQQSRVTRETVLMAMGILPGFGAPAGFMAGGKKGSPWDPTTSINATFSNANFSMSNSNFNTGGAPCIKAILSPTSVYAEVTFTVNSAGTGSGFGFSTATPTSGSSGFPNGSAGSGAWGSAFAIVGGGWRTVVSNTNNGSNIATPAIGDVIGIYFDAASKAYLSLNGTFYSSSGGSTGSTPSTSWATLSGSTVRLGGVVGSSSAVATINTVGPFVHLPSGASPWG